jgi:6-phosphogluconolactonase
MVLWGMIRAPFLFRPALHYLSMKIRRRIFAFFILTCPLVLSVACRSANKPTANQKYLVFVGTYTTKTESKGIYAFGFDSDTGKLTPKGVAAETPDPSWVVVHPNGKYAYAANEAGKASTVSAFAVDAKSGKLTPLNQMPALGEDPCYLSFDKTGKYVFVANYTSGNVVVFPIGADGKLGTATASVRDEGKLGPNNERQDGPHAHWIAESVHNIVYVVDLGLDRVIFYDFDPAKGTLTLHKPVVNLEYSFPESSAVLAPGTGPRHIAIARNGEHHQFLFVLGELDSTVTVLGDWKDGFFDSLQKVAMLPAASTVRNDAAEIALHPSGKFLYASNRGHDSIAIFTIDSAVGKLTSKGYAPTGGKEPRHFAIDPSGKYLLAENQFSNNIVIFKIDAATGGLTPTGQVLEVPSPVNIAFLSQD